MRVWLIATVISLGSAALVASDGELVPDDGPPDDSALFLYMDARSERDIEARRRSALDKNFMRFGRSFEAYDSDTDDGDDAGDALARASRSHNKNDNFIRFGRGRNGDFLRFGRGDMRQARGLNDKNFIRFGRGVAPLTRSRRDAFKRGTNRDMLRFGRRDNFLRFGRMQAPNDTGDSALLPILARLAIRLNERNEDKHPLSNVP